MMKFVIAPDSFKETLSAEKAAIAIQKGFLRVFPEAEYQLLPVGDGGEGTLDENAPRRAPSCFSYGSAYKAHRGTDCFY